VADGDDAKTLRVEAAKKGSLMAEQHYCVYFVYSVPAGCTTYSTGQTVYLDCPDTHDCEDIYIDSGPCAGTYLLAQECSCT
jgi:hypothetical protein